MAWNDSLPALGAASLCALGLTACSVAGPRTSPLPTGGPTMQEIYRGHAIGVRPGELRQPGLPLRPPTELAPGPVKASALRQLETRFPRLPNPDLVMYVFPHLARGAYPVPGYFTAFPMYERVEYQLPGEGYARLEAAPALQR